MKIRSVLGLLFILGPHSAISQQVVPSGEPVGVGNLGAGLNVFQISPSGFASRLSVNNIYNPLTGEVLLPSILSIGTEPDAGRIFNELIFRLADDGRFDLIEFDEISPEEECTVAEVDAAISQLSLELNLEEAEELIGCNARITPGATDLELGRTMLATWEGDTIVLNPRFMAGSSTFLQSIGISPFLSVNNPRIVLSFLEGNLIEYSVSEANEFVFCFGIQLKTEYESLTSSLISTFSHDQISDILNCSGRLLSTSVSSEGIEEVYSWTAIAADMEMGTASTNETVTGRFLDGIAQSFDFRGSESISSSESCTVVGLSSAHELILIGSAEMELLDLVPCLPRSVSTSVSEGVSMVTYFWFTANNSPSIFVTTNRTFVVVTVDGYVSDVRFFRN